MYREFINTTLRSVSAMAVIVGISLFSATPAQASEQEASTVVELDPHNLASARLLVDLIMPPAQRESMANDMVVAMMKNLIDGIMQDPKLRSAFAEHPKMEAVFEQFIDRQRAKALTSMRKSLPDMIVAMSRAYARQFTVQQLDDMQVFFASPTGQVYASKSAKIMSDPDVAEWQRNSMQESMATLPAEMDLLMAELKAAFADSNTE